MGAPTPDCRGPKKHVIGPSAVIWPSFFEELQILLILNTDLTAGTFNSACPMKSKGHPKPRRPPGNGFPRSRLGEYHVRSR